MAMRTFPKEVRRVLGGLRRILRPRAGFNDLSRVSRRRRIATSPVIQFYSSGNNIGNYLPVLGIQKMLSMQTDTWCIHDRNIDFDFINRSYVCGIIGGAGLLESGFEHFWERISKECTIPLIIWGVGGCFPDRAKARGEALGVSRRFVRNIAERCDLINLRDDISADYYQIRGADISLCPTVEYLDDFASPPQATDPRVLLSEHRPLVGGRDILSLRRALDERGISYRRTDNGQWIHLPYQRIIDRYYRPSPAVVTTRLHGAIIAYGLGVPYVAVARDEKLRAFHRLYRNGALTEDTSQVPDLLEQIQQVRLGARELGPVREFGSLARRWIATQVHAAEHEVASSSKAA